MLGEELFEKRSSQEAVGAINRIEECKQVIFLIFRVLVAEEIMLVCILAGAN